MIESLNRLTNGNGLVATALIIVLVALVLGRLLRQIGPALQRNGAGARIAKYAGIISQGWVVTAIVLTLMWLLGQRDGMSFTALLDDIGVNARLPALDVTIWTGAMFAAIALNSFLIGHLRKFFGGKATAAGLDILPETPAETAVFQLLVSPTAGIGEEIVYRGFLLGQVWSMSGNGWIAALVSSLVFGLLHFYQGWWGVLRTAIIGMILAVPVVLTGSLIPSIITHTLADMLSAVARKPVAPQPA